MRIYNIDRGIIIKLNKYEEIDIDEVEELSKEETKKKYLYVIGSERNYIKSSKRWFGYYLGVGGIVEGEYGVYIGFDKIRAGRREYNSIDLEIENNKVEVIHERSNLYRKREEIIKRIKESYEDLYKRG
jgi:hypothetical protein